ncbi:MAG: hypothetical protein H6745_33280 [Deltaproteobacteria bacterium]|nr:hypothetical protein [Deltaproteobacteria bacterium]
MPRTLSVLSVALLGACANTAEPTPTTGDKTPDSNIDLNTSELGSVLASCSTAGSSGYDSVTKTLTLDLTASVSSVVIAVPNKTIAVNHNPCVDSAGAALTTTSVKKIVVNGTANDDEVIIDLAQGSFGAIFSATGGVTVDMAGGTGDAFKVRGGDAAEKITAGTDSTDDFFELSGDKFADVIVSNAEAYTFALGGGADVFTGQGGAISASHLKDGVTSLTAITADLTINGGDGADTLTGGDGDDTINGGEGNDTIKSAANDDGSDVVEGDGGVDTMDYSARTGDLTVTLDDTANDGLSGEADNIKVSVENVTGGSGDDAITGSDVSNTLKGGDGDDTLNGGAGNSSDCTLDVDVLDGGNGDDTFSAGAAADCGDTYVCGAGSDVVTYGSRTNPLVIDIDNTADDGEASELDNVKTDCEKVIGGSGDDTITGSTAADILDGGDGDDTLNGGAGDDTFIAGAADDGGDVMNGGAGVDTVDYSARTGDLTITLCIASNVTGDSDVGDCATHNDGLASEEDQIINCEHIIAGDGADDITGASSADTLEGGAGDDIIDGGGGADNIFGDDDDDTLTGGDGDDYIDGGAGTNTADGEGGDGDICTQATASNCEL